MNNQRIVRRSLFNRINFSYRFFRKQRCRQPVDGFGRQRNRLTALQPMYRLFNGGPDDRFHGLDYLQLFPIDGTNRQQPRDFSCVVHRYPTVPLRAEGERMNRRKFYAKCKFFATHLRHRLMRAFFCTGLYHQKTKLIIPHFTIYRECKCARHIAIAFP